MLLLMGVEFVAPPASVPASATASCEDGSSSQYSLGVVVVVVAAAAVAAAVAAADWSCLGYGCWQQQQQH